MRSIDSALLALFAFSALALPAQTTSTPARTDATPAARPAYESEPRFQSAMTEARKLEREHQWEFARDSYNKANKIAGGTCVDCLNKIYDIQLGLKHYKEAVAAATQLEALAAGPRDKSIAEGLRGTALMRQAGDKPKPDQLEAAHAVLQAALTDFPKNNSARWSDACVLARLGKNEDATKQFAECAERAAATDPMKVRARHFAENPALSLAKMAPAFEVTALDGQRFNLDSMGGRIVLIDFWATWCGPCNEELPHLKKIAREFANEPLVIISISWDSDEAKWKQFIAKNEMTWVQYRDADHKLSEQFGIHAIPHYFTIDSDGVLTAEMLGSGSDVEGKLKKLIKRAHEAKPAQPLTAQVSGN